MSATVDEIRDVIAKISHHINSGNPVLAVTAGNNFTRKHGKVVSADFWFQMELAYRLMNDTSSALVAHAQMIRDTEGFTPEMRRDHERDYYLAIIRKGGKLHLQRRRELSEVQEHLWSLYLQEGHPNRNAVTHYALARVYAALGNHSAALGSYAQAELLWSYLESGKRSSEIDEQWRRNNRIRYLLELARASTFNPRHWPQAMRIADIIINDDGELNSNRKHTARLLKFAPVTYWYLAHKIGP